LLVRQALIGAQVVPSPLYPLLQAQEAVPASVTVHAAAGAHPPLFTTQAPTVAVHVVPLPEYPELQAQELVPEPVLVQVAFGSHPPCPLLQELMGAASAGGDDASEGGEPASVPGLDPLPEPLLPLPEPLLP